VPSAYDKVVLIWEGLADWFVANDFAFDYARTPSPKHAPRPTSPATTT
jgi:hypothetical protein